MEQEKQQTAIGKFLRGNLVKNIIAPVGRGLIKQIPFVGTPVVELLSNLTQPKTMIASITGGLSVEVNNPLKHSYVSIGVQIVSAALIVWAFYTKQITIQDVLGLLNQIKAE